MNVLEDRILFATDLTFEELALDVFRYQYDNVEIYRLYCDSIKRKPSSINHFQDIPFLPIELFKNHTVTSKQKTIEKIFESSGTTGQIPSKHFVADLSLYEKSFGSCFTKVYGDIADYTILALLPSYLERDNSSLVYMASKLIDGTNNKQSGFFLNEYEQLYNTLKLLKDKQQKTILLGVTFALLDFADNYKLNFPELTIIETGGMKGRRDELTREEVHLKLCNAFNVKLIHSEYGMTELLSQAYSNGNGVFYTPTWMKVVIRDTSDPLTLQKEGVLGAVNVIDLANLYSCSFIATGDLGRTRADGGFEILGRIDNSEIRGCNLMAI